MSPKHTKHDERPALALTPETIPFWNTWLMGESAEQDSICVKKIYIDINEGNLIDGVLFSQIMYWHGTSSETHQPRMTIKKDGFLWLAKKYDEWEGECRVNYDSARASITRMVKRGLLVKAVYRFNGLATVHIRVDPEGFRKAVMELQNKRSVNAINRNPECDTVADRIAIQSQSDLLSNRNPLTETTAITTAENTSSQPASAVASDPPLSVQVFGPQPSVPPGSNGPVPLQSGEVESTPARPAALSGVSADKQILQAEKRQAKSRKDPKPRPRDPVYDAIAAGSYNMTTTSGKSRYIGVLTAGVRACTPEEHRATLADDLPRMYAWYKTAHPGISAPAKAETICKYLAEWRLSGTAPAQPRPPVGNELQNMTLVPDPETGALKAVWS